MATALISVYDKDGIVEFASGLEKLEVDILASGGTAKTLAAAGVQVRDIAELVGPPLLGHRVVTLSREIHAGLLANSRNPDDADELRALRIPWIDLVCVDLYPIRDAITQKLDADQVNEMTDVGGPTMLCAAAKGRRLVVCDPLDREPFLVWMRAGCREQGSVRKQLCAKAQAVAAKHLLTAAVFHSGGVIGASVTIPPIRWPR